MAATWAPGTLDLATLLDFSQGLPLVVHAPAAAAGGPVPGWLPPGWPAEQPVWDGAELARLVLTRGRRVQPAALAAELGLPGPGPDATDDTDAARTIGAVFAAGLARLQGLELGVVEELHRLLPPTSSLATLMAGVVARRRRSGEVPRPIVEWIPAAPGPIHGEPEAPSADDNTFDPVAVAALLAPDGPVAQRLPTYEHRPQQMDMTAQVAMALAYGQHLLVEAGTGTGKSLAYLLPALLWAQQTGQRVVVSTHTITLQEQLWRKDIPFLQQALDLEVPVALAKGRSNFICLRKWEEDLMAVGFAASDAERSTHARMAVWLTESATGDRSELGLQGGEDEVWRRVMSETETCIGSKCKWYARHCFAFRARRRVREAQVVVANHALVLTDRATGGQVLPPYRYLVVDEAHHLEAVATEHLGINVHQRELQSVLLRLVRSPRGEGQAGVLPALQRWLTGAAAEDAALATVAARAREAVDGLFGTLAAVAMDRGNRDEDGGFMLRLTESVFLDPRWRAVEVVADNAATALQRLADGLARLGETVAAEHPDRPPSLDGLLAELDRHAGDLFQAATSIGTVLAAADARLVYWVQGTGTRVGGARLSLHAAPIDVGPQLRSELWETLEGAVLCSATLAVDQDFSHVKAQLGLDGLPADRVTQAQVPSPFRYDRQALVLVPEDMPSPRADETEYSAAVVGYLETFLPAIAGGALVLFTSHRQLRQVYNGVRDSLRQQGLLPLAQGIDGDRSQLLDEFRSTPGAVLFGAASFWEGVDVPGNRLSCVVLVRLPFAPPTHPVFAARSEDLERRGLSGFHHLALPQAVIRFKQGFGRLIRTGSDRGVVLILDGRVHPGRRGYGSRFLRSLPGPRIQVGRRADITRAAVTFLQGRDMP